MSIKFGTSGWRAVIAEEFTFSNVRKAAKGIASYVKAHCPRNNFPPTVIVGYDTRFNSREFALAAAGVLASNGVKVLFTKRDAPTPAISFQVIKKRAQGAVNITASHNPPEYNGLKFSPSHGGPASLEATKEIEANIAGIKGEVVEPSAAEFKRPICQFDPAPEYLNRIKDIIGLSAIRKAAPKIVVDVMHGTGRGYLDHILRENRCRVETLNENLNPIFGGRPPEPARANIERLIKEVKSRKADLGLALDGDADRFGVVDENGRFYSPDEVIALIFKHLIETRPKLKLVARTHSTTTLIDRIAGKYSVEVVETPIGFKYIAEVLMTGDCIIGGEESGGLSIAGHIPEKDGILACLLVAEMVAVKSESLSVILRKLYRQFGKSYPGKFSLNMEDEHKKRLMDFLKSHPPKNIIGLKVAELNKMDGYKFILEDESWVLIRPSGTEPLVRFHFEGESAAKRERLMNYCKDLMKSVKSTVDKASPLRIRKAYPADKATSPEED